MQLKKRFYVDGQTTITAENLNDIQDAIIALEEGGGGASVFFEDDGSGNVSVVTSDGEDIVINDDGNGNVNLEVM